MEVHPPEHPIHTWRDFFIHIATIVVGLLIAIGLEQSVEWLHHRHVVHTAHNNIRAEMQANRHLLEADQQSLESLRTLLLADLRLLRGLPKRADSEDPHLGLNLDWSGLGESAYQTARETGAFAYMPFEEVQQIDDVYRQQDLLANAGVSFFRSLYRITTPLQGGRSLKDISAAEVQGMTERCAEALLEIDTLQALMRPLPDDYSRFTRQ